ncbi:MAG: hypothetical protein K6G88_10790 [Lachnospiraceae bacterium]|nr:hypothetical protein [Lachnospiraceae bacterium]
MNLMEKLLTDQKESIKKIIDPNNNAVSSFELIMRSFNYFLSSNHSLGKDYDYEKREASMQIYKLLGWNDEKSFDVINSFYIIFKCSLVYSNVLSKNTQTSYCFDKGVFCYRNKFGYTPIGKKKHIEKINDEETTCHKAIYSTFINEDKNAKKIEKLAALSHTVANFCPVPNAKFNIMKGCMAYDFLPLFVDKIEDCICNNTSMCCEIKQDGKIKKIDADIKEVTKWHEWLVNNKDKYALSDYYDVSEHKRLIGNPLFKNQKLDNPLPQNQEEVGVCLDNMIERIYNRADYLNMLSMKGRKK